MIRAKSFREYITKNAPDIIILGERHSTRGLRAASGATGTHTIYLI